MRLIKSLFKDISLAVRNSIICLSMCLIPKTILFDVNVIKSLDSPSDKVDGILKNRLPVEDTKIAFELKDKEVSITIPEEILRADGLQIMKHFIQLDIFKFVPTLTKVSFVESHVNKQSQEKKPETKEKTPEQKTA